MNAQDSLVHTKWNCKYHMVLILKYRRKVFYEEKRSEIIEIEVYQDYIRLLLSIP